MHSKYFSWLILFGLVMAFNGLAVGQTPPPSAGSAAAPAPRLGDIVASRVVGDVTVEDTTTNVRAALQDNQVIRQGSIVRTGDNSSVVLIFSNGATISLAFGSELNIEQFLQNPFEGNYEPAKSTDEPSVSVTSIKLNRGELVGNVKKLRTHLGSKFTVGTPVGAAGIRGTTFRIVYRPTGDGRAFNFALTTVEGNVELATGTISTPISVTDNKEVVLTEVVVDSVTNTITATTSTGETVTVSLPTTPPPPVSDAPATTIQQVTSVATLLATAVLDVIIPPPSQSAPASTPSIENSSSGDGEQGDTSGNSNQNEGQGEGNNQSEGQSESQGSNPNENANQGTNQNSNQNTSQQGDLPGSPGNTTQPSRITPEAGKTPGL